MPAPLTSQRRAFNYERRQYPSIPSIDFVAKFLIAVPVVRARVIRLARAEAARRMRIRHVVAGDADARIRAVGAISIRAGYAEAQDSRNEQSSQKSRGRHDNILFTQMILRRTRTFCVLG